MRFTSHGEVHILTNNADATLPMLDQDSNSQNSNSAFVEDGSFLRLKTLRLGYTLPKDFLSKAQIKRCKPLCAADESIYPY